MTDDASHPDVPLPMTESLRQAIVGAIRSPGLQLAIREASVPSNLWSKQLASSFAPVLERIRAQQTEMSRAVAAPMLRVQEQMAAAVASSMMGQVARLQREMASSLGLAVMANAGVQAKLAGPIVNQGLMQALQRVNQAAALRIEIPTEESFTRLSHLIDSGEIDEDALEQTTEQVNEADP